MTAAVADVLAVPSNQRGGFVLREEAEDEYTGVVSRYSLTRLGVTEGVVKADDAVQALLRRCSSPPSSTRSSDEVKTSSASTVTAPTALDTASDQVTLAVAILSALGNVLQFFKKCLWGRCSGSSSGENNNNNNNKNNPFL